MALGITRETAPGLLVKLDCGLFGKSFWELGRKCQSRVQVVNLFNMRSLLERRRGERGEGGGGYLSRILRLFYVFFWFRHRFLFLIIIINLLQQLSLKFKAFELFFF